MTSKHRLTRSFRTISAILYTLNIAVATAFAWEPNYLHVLVGAITGILSTVMLCVALESPTMIITRIENSKLGEQLFTFRGRYMVDLFIALFLFAMAPWGVVTGCMTLGLIFGIRILGVKQPDAFNEIFRQSDMESQADSYTLESEYDADAPAVERR